jgi:uncharacterized protein
MKRLIALAALLLWSFAGSLLAAEDAAKPDKLRVLLTVGGHGFDEKPFSALFESIPDITFKKIDLPKDAGLLKSGLEKDFDVIVMYDMVGGFTPEQQKAFVELLQAGIGVVSLHHNLGAHADWDEFTKIIGGKFLLKDAVIGGQKLPKSGYEHGQDIQVTVADKEHPITKGLSDFQIHDETYSGTYTSPDAKVLLKTDHPKNSPSLAWVTTYGKSRVFYLQLGHDAQAYANPAFRELVARGIRWAAGRDPVAK